MDPERFPSASAYLARLPAGLASHPECQVKASVLRDVVATDPLVESDMRQLPAPIQQLLREPPPVSAWIPEVHSIFALLATRDGMFAKGEAGLAAYEEWSYERNRKLLSRPLYRALFLLVSPERLLRNVSGRWEAFRRGSKLELVERFEGGATLRIVYPSFLFEATAVRGMRAVFRAATELAGGRDVQVEVGEALEHQATLTVRYQ